MDEVKTEIKKVKGEMTQWKTNLSNNTKFLAKIKPIRTSYIEKAAGKIKLVTDNFDKYYEGNDAKKKKEKLQEYEKKIKKECADGLDIIIKNVQSIIEQDQQQIDLRAKKIEELTNELEELTIELGSLC